ncbi:MAG: heme-binding protein [Spirochaetales bacterium]|uniref:Heme-binding protein n=1 Tax=Candidatus Thalassospirochaeta sargassi TaxID=3119039 RepID=A0AAJ1IGZ6_9SPIO|nr:heme-binding protein [Spirochaetales bacterium]
MKKVNVLTNTDIEKIYQLYKERIGAEGAEFALAVADSHGELVFFIKTDNCPVSAASIAVNKAYTSARDRQKTSSLDAASKQLGFAVSSLGDIRYTGLGGGVPVVVGDDWIGAVAVSGMSQEEDEALAEKMVRAVTG